MIDSSEAKINTRLPQTVIRASTVLVGLEHATGADLILSPLNEPKIKELNAAGLWLLRQHAAVGILVQRKSGRDFINSIAHLPEIELRMLEWNPSPWLLITGRLGCDAKDKLTINGRAVKYGYWSAIGALDSWQMRGGNWTALDKDSQIAKWCSDVVGKLGQEKVVVKQRQALVKMDKKMEEAVNVLTGFPGIGVKTAVSIVETCGSLKAGLIALSALDILKRKQRPEGVGVKTIEDYRRVMGLKSGEEIK